MAGRSQTLSGGASLNVPFTWGSRDLYGRKRDEEIASFTVVNRTAATTVFVFFGQGNEGQPIITVAPGAVITLPIMPTSWLTFDFSPKPNVDSGFIYFHIDTEALTASSSVISINAQGSNSVNGYTTLPNGAILQWGTVTGVPADFSADAVLTFPLPFPNAVYSVTATADDGGAASADIHNAQVNAVALAGANVRVAGGAPASTVNVRFMAVGI